MSMYSRTEKRSKTEQHGAPLLELGEKVSSKGNWEGVAGEVAGKQGQCGVLEVNEVVHCFKSC